VSNTAKRGLGIAGETCAQVAVWLLAANLQAPPAMVS